MSREDDATEVSNVRPLKQPPTREQVRAGQTRVQQVAASVILVLLVLAVVGGLVRLNLWIWTGR